MNERIKELRKLKGLNQSAFAKSLGLSQNHISSIEKGVRGLTTRTINDICRIYNVNPNWLINGTGDIFIDTTQFDTNDEVKEFIKMFLQLDKETQQLIIQLTKKTLNK
ncbi:helix-turn-helix transcriptional regulator (plasmid) [Clostridium botulinum]|uniref:Repressor n=1 Tax=Clostridium botulinum C/D str. DC5 TaxID=1443128 RepID=A0A0A0I783_CLOBO|nr:helix-turn-helix transcriptional regulator [Clostridium botulinum]KGM96156.1 repressor [Clostridium botulinum C/D str. DC5]KOC56630.1 repressor [Clostridium botulinum]KOC58193.1 repressor [Clostridium botulinum]MCD3235268.1 helix-turn-helix transcriptional regulator [Clostridium botulinum D/C]MCD3241195.1 helix-turn-helix transcriptional regulator [Clostridium botulinum D/C]